MIRRLLILSIHFFLTGFGGLEYCVSKGMRKFTYKPGSHYACRINCQHPAYRAIMVSLTENRGEASLASYLMCTAHESHLPLLVTGKIVLN
jgi:hypothetical protein